MVTQHLHVIHFVDVVTSEDEDVFGPVVFFHDVHVLPYGIGGAPVPGLVIELLARRQHIDELVAFARQEGPAVLQVAQERMRFVLGDDADFEEAGIDAVRQREVDDAVTATKVHGWFGTLIGQLVEA